MNSSGRRRMSSRTAYYTMFAPALILLIGVMYPFLQGVYLALTDKKLYLPSAHFIGLGNIAELFVDPAFGASMARTLAYTVAVIAVQLPLGLAIAYLLMRDGRVQKLLRNTLVLPLLIPPVVAGLIWKTLMQPQTGILNYLLNSAGLPSFSWLSHTSTALMSVVLIDTWVFTPFAALILLAGLQSIPDDLIEAARVDGAGKWLIFRAIQWPWLMPFAILVALFRVTDSLKSFELFYATTRGGPLNATRTLHVTAYEEAFRWSSIGRAMAIVLVLWFISYVTSFFLMRLWERKSER